MELKPYKIRNITIDPPLVLSPMSGITTSPFRRLIKECNPGAVGLVISEFISVEALTRRVPRSLDMMRFEEVERPYAILIFGYDVNRMRDAALMAQDAGADIVDINCGCPAPKVVKKGGGCELMRQPIHLSSIIREVRRALTIPLTIKIRSGWDSSSLNAMEIAKIAQVEGVEGLAIHGRTRAQLYKGEADWSVVEEVARTLQIPVFGSGDVTDRSSALNRLGGCVSGLYIGRAALYNPLVFAQIVSGRKENLKQNHLLALSILQRYGELLRDEFHPKRCVGRMKQLVSQMCRGFAWRKDLCRVETFEEQLDIIAAAMDCSRHIPVASEGELFKVESRSFDA